MYLAIEGVIGVGKTSLALRLQPIFNAGLLLEAFEENPFLSSFYEDRHRYAFQTQVFFLLSRYRQQGDAVSRLINEGSLIADYTFRKDALFARLNLTGDELETYFQVHKALAERVVPPDLTVFLRVDTDVAMQRIAMRDRPYEREMDRGYIEDLSRAYQKHFAEHTNERVLTIDATLLDFISRQEDLTYIADRIRHALSIPPFQTELPFQGGKAE